MDADRQGAPGTTLDLVRRIQAGDRQAWGDLYGRYRDRLLLAIRVRLGAGLRTRIESEDVLQSVIRQALDDLEGFEPRGERALERWLDACVANKVRKLAEHFAAARRAGTTALPEELADRAAVGEGLRYRDTERYERLERALVALPEPLRDVLVLRRIQGLGNGEAAAMLGRSPEATSKLHARAVARLTLALAPGSASDAPDDGTR